MALSLCLLMPSVIAMLVASVNSVHHSSILSSSAITQFLGDPSGGVLNEHTELGTG